MSTLDNLKHFVAVVENKGVLRAAEKVFISPSSITRSVQLLEAEAGVALFDRIGRNVQLNREGERFYDRAKTVLEGYERLFVAKGQGTPRLSGHFSIGASHYLCEHLLAGLAARCVERSPEASFAVYSLDSNILLRKLHAGEVDIGILVSPKLPETLDGVDFESGQMYPCVGKGHRLAGKPFSYTKAKLSDIPAIIHRPTDSIERCDNHPMFQKHGIKPHIEMFWDSDHFALGVLAKNRHWSLLPEFVIDSDPRVVKLAVPADWDAGYRISLVWNRKMTVSGLKDALLALLPKVKRR